jgi:hypothetical protein
MSTLPIQGYVAPARRKRTKWYKRSKKARDWSINSTLPPSTSEDWQRFQDVYTAYREAFTELCEATYAAYYGEEYSPHSRAGEIIFDKIQRSSLPSAIELQDIEARLTYIWYNASRRYFYRKPSVPIYNYLFRMSLFELCHWLNKPYLSPPYEEHSIELDTDLVVPKLDWNFVVHGSPHYRIFSRLTAYERYLLYLRYTLELDNSAIGRIGKRTRKSILASFESLLIKLRNGFSLGAIRG